MNLDLLNRIEFILEGKKGKWIIQHGKPYFMAAASGAKDGALIGSIIGGPIFKIGGAVVGATGGVLYHAAKIRNTKKSKLHKSKSKLHVTKM